MTRIVATGTFDILHPGHVYYLNESKKLGDELWVIVARDANVKHKPRPVIPEAQRRNMVAALRPVDHAVLGDLHDMLRPIREIKPDIITIGFNQHFDTGRLKDELIGNKINAEVVRIGNYTGDAICSSRLIISAILRRSESNPGKDHS